ncbi:hypothetical protein ACF0H5_008206 [Mactra antiquata]
MGIRNIMFFFMLLTAVLVCGVDAELSLASYYGDHMVLQQAPKSAQIWGYADTVGDLVTVKIGPDGPSVQTKVIKDQTIGRNIWKVMLPPQKGSCPVNISISSSEGSLNIIDVLFGDVWICSGQSNMQFTLSMVFNFSAEIADAQRYPNIRLFTAAQKWSKKSEYDLLQVEQYWTRPNRDAVGHSDWSYFSAVCWLYGKYLYETLQRPIGLMVSSWGGTPIEAWSSQDVTNQCSKSRDVSNLDAAPQNTPTQLWKAMIHPLLNMTMYGVIWYQGESNAPSAGSYTCLFTNMIEDWRTKFHEASQGQTDRQFPFGFVQLAPNRNIRNITTGFPDIRWHQTADMGYVPNALMPNTFMSVAIDLPDYNSPYGSIHPRDKQDVAYRLYLGGLQVAYNIKAMGRYQGPQITAFFIDIGYHTLRLELDHSKQPIDVKSKDGFEVCCSRNNQTQCDGTDSTWMTAPIIKYDKTSVTIPSCNGQWTMGVRYLWQESPCVTPKMCPVYSVENDLPMAPYKLVGIIGL